MESSVGAGVPLYLLYFENRGSDEATKAVDGDGKAYRKSGSYLRPRAMCALLAL